jgi:hypothetical protein
MKDVNGVELEVGQTIVVATKSNGGSNVPGLKRATILEIHEGTENHPLPGIRVKYEESGRISEINGFPGSGYGMDARVCVIR